MKMLGKQARRNKTHFGISKALCGRNNGWRTSMSSGVDCKDCRNRLVAARDAMLPNN